MRRTNFIIGGCWYLLLLHCSFLKPAPVDCGTSVIYIIRDEFGKKSVCTLRFKKARQGLLALTVDQRDSAASLPKNGGFGLFDTIEPVIAPDENGAILVSRFLRRKGGERLALSEFGPPWLPPYQLTSHRRIALGARFGAATVDSVFMWRNNRLCTVRIGNDKSTISGTSYYNASTGLLLSGAVVNSSTRYYSPDSTARIQIASSNIPGL
jgi:hypothetical protein